MEILCFNIEVGEKLQAYYLKMQILLSSVLRMTQDLMRFETKTQYNAAALSL